MKYHHAIDICMICATSYTENSVVRQSCTCTKFVQKAPFLIIFLVSALEWQMTIQDAWQLRMSNYVFIFIVLSSETWLFFKSRVKL